MTFFIGTLEEVDTKVKSLLSAALPPFHCHFGFFTAVGCALDFCFGITPARRL